MKNNAYQFLMNENKKNNFLDFDITKISLKNSEVRKIENHECIDLVLEYDWLKTMPLFIIHCFGIYFKIEDKEYLGGIVIYSKENSLEKIEIFNNFIFKDKTISLTRGISLWWTPKNTASYFISKTQKWLKNNTNYKIISSAVDPYAGEIGTIYQSLNWKYIGLLSGSYLSVDDHGGRFSIIINNKLIHLASLKKEIKSLKKEDILKKYPEAKFITQYRKRRYFYFIGTKKENKENYKKIKHLILPFPKRGIPFVGIIYLITNKINNKKYIGQTTRGIIQRIEEHFTDKRSRSYINLSIKKYGNDNFDVAILDTAKTVEELNNKEIYYINKFNSTNRNLGYNIEYGGKNSSVNPETRKKLSEARKNIKQNKDWVVKRIDAVSKKVLKISRERNEIVKKFKSLADAGRLNEDGLSYQQILRKCLGHVSNEKKFLWCYEEDYINNKIKTKKIENNKKITDFSEDEINEMKILYENKKISIRKISKMYNITFSTIHKILTTKNNFIKKDDDNLVAVCKKTGKTFKDYKNKSGCLTNHIKLTYPDFKFESKFIRKSIENKTGKFWYEKYFDLKKE